MNALLRNPFRDLDQKKLRHSSDALKTQNDYYKIVNKRIGVFALVIILVFSMVVVRLAFLQIRGEETYTAKLESYTSKKQTDMTPRGMIYDRNGKVVADTVSALNITYFPPKNTSSEEQWELAQKFSKQFKTNHDRFTLSDYQDAYMFLHTDANGEKDNGNNLLSGDELNLGSGDAEKLKRERITQEMVEKEFSDEELNAYAIYGAMRRAPSNQLKVVLEDVDKSIVYYLEEHKDEYPGFDVDMGGWKRNYPYGATFRDVLGSVSTSVQGVPSELKSYYEAKGYSMVDRVGTSGLEKQYEDLLTGTRKVSEITYDENGIAVLNEINSGKKGYNLHMSIDIELQKQVDDVLEKVLKNASNDSRRKYFTNAYVILMNPQTGEIYAMSGKVKGEDGKITNFANGNYKSGVVPGSIVKGATVYMGLTEGAIDANTIFVDAPIQFKGSAEKRSYVNHGPVDAVKALSVSSNVYMWYTVMALAGVNYVPNGPLIVNDYAGIVRLMRSYYSMFGLGTSTGLDVPDETASSFVGNSTDVGKFLDFAIGQYDTYTPIQIAQYVSTLANGGKKVQPKLVNTATEINSDYVVYENKTTILSTLKGSESDLEVVRTGFHRCVLDGNCGGSIKSLPYDIAAKTGTAESAEHGGKTTNAALIGWAPYDNPSLAFVCLAPDSDTNEGTNLAGNICYQEIMPEIIQDFFKKYPIDKKD